MPNNSILGIGSFVPEHRSNNADLEAEFNLEDGWIKARTGIETRAVAAVDDAVSDLGFRAATKAIEEASQVGLQKSEIKSLFLATSTPDYLLPPTSAKLSYQLGLTDCAAMDVTVACCGFLYSLILADSLVQSSQQPSLVIASNILSRRCAADDVSTRPIFADGAGAIVLASTPNQQGILSSCWSSDGSKSDSLIVPDGGSRSPIGPNTYQKGDHLMRLHDGAAIFKYAVQSMAEMGLDAVKKANLSMDDIDWWIPHQASRRIIDASRRILKVNETKTLTTVEKFGNSSAATIPVTFDYFRHKEPRIKAGDTVLMTAAAAGMTSAAVLLRVT